VSIESPKTMKDCCRRFIGRALNSFLWAGWPQLCMGRHGLTFDLDVVYKRSPDNYPRLVAALENIDPYLRGAPSGLPFRWMPRRSPGAWNFTLITRLGAIDILGEIAGGEYDELFPYAVPKEAFGIQVPCLRLDKLIEVKRAAGRPKDYEAISELEALAGRTISRRRLIIGSKSPAFRRSCRGL